MKKLLLLSALLIFACSSDDGNNNSNDPSTQSNKIVFNGVDFPIETIELLDGGFNNPNYNLNLHMTNCNTFEGFCSLDEIEDMIEEDYDNFNLWLYSDNTYSGLLDDGTFTINNLTNTALGIWYAEIQYFDCSTQRLGNYIPLSGQFNVVREIDNNINYYTLSWSFSGENGEDVTGNYYGEIPICDQPLGF